MFDLQQPPYSQHTANTTSVALSSFQSKISEERKDKEQKNIMGAWFEKSSDNFWWSICSLASYQDFHNAA